MKYLLITDIPAPWREKVYEIVYKELGDKFHVVYCKHNEKRRLWKFPLGKHPKTFLKSMTVSTKRTKENFLNLGIIPFLIKNKPKVVICFSLNPTIYLTLFLSKILGCKIAVFADTWLGRDGKVSFIHTLARKIFCNFFPDAYIGASKQTFNWYKKYNPHITRDHFFLSHLCADNDFFSDHIKDPSLSRRYDLLFSGRIVDLKNPLFFTEVAVKVKEKLGNCTALIIGEGDEKLKENMFRILEENNVEYNFPGFIPHEELPLYYSQAKILLLPTSGDCWGVVINEAMVSGLTVITTDMTAAAGELVIDGQNGFILPLNSDLWVEKITFLLSNTEKLEEFSLSAQESVSHFNFDEAAQGIVNAVNYMERI